MVLSKGGSFLIPRGALCRPLQLKAGNTYSITNISNIEARLFFAQSRKLRQAEPGDEEGVPAASKKPKSRASAAGSENEAESSSASKKAKKNIKGVRESLEPVEEEEEDDQPASKKVKTGRPVGRPRKS